MVDPFVGTALFAAGLGIGYLLGVSEPPEEPTSVPEVEP